MPKQIQIIGGEIRELDVDEKSVVAIPPGTEIIFEDTMAAISKVSQRTRDEVIDAIIADKKLTDKRAKAEGSKAKAK